MGLIKIGAFWKRADRNGDMYLSGNFDDKMIVETLEALTKRIRSGKRAWVKVWPNKHKESEKQPDYLLYWSSDDEAKQANDHYDGETR